MKKYLILSVLTLVMLFVLGNNSYAATINMDKMSINIPDKFINDDTYISSSDYSQYRTYYYDGANYNWKEDKMIHFDYYSNYTPTKYRVEYTKENLDSLVKQIGDSDNTTDYYIYDYTVISNSLTNLAKVCKASLFSICFSNNETASSLVLQILPANTK